MRSLAISIAAAPFLTLSLSATQPTPAATPSLTPEQKMAQPVEKVMKNIQVLTGMPMNQLASTMTFIATSLGVKCSHCHEAADYSSDAKSEKKTARRMIRMQLGVNKQTFDGKMEVTCYTCHRGSIKPVSVPSLDLADWKAKEPAWTQAEAKTPEPKAEELLARFVEASGGRAALTKHTTRLTSGTETDGEGASESLETGTEGGKPVKSVQAFDGKTFWMQHGERKPNPIWLPITEVMRRDAEFATPLELLADKDARVRGLEKNGARQAWVVEAKTPDGLRERLWFDGGTGLLVHRAVTVETYLGRLVFAVDYDDYRDVDGVKMPFVCRWSQPGHGWTETVKEVKNDVDAPDDRFRMPGAP